MEYTDNMKEIQDCLEDWSKKGYEGIMASYAVLEYAQWIERIDFDQAKELMYRFVERMAHPEWND